MVGQFGKTGNTSSDIVQLSPGDQNPPPHPIVHLNIDKPRFSGGINNFVRLLREEYLQDYAIFIMLKSRSPLYRQMFCKNKLSILIQSIDKWYIFGLIVTEHALVTTYFKEVESRLGRHITMGDYTQNIEAMDAFREFAELKCKWPYRRKDSQGTDTGFSSEKEIAEAEQLLDDLFLKTERAIG